MPQESHSRPSTTLRYQLAQPLNAAVRRLRDAEDIARLKMPDMPTADRIRSIYEQINADVLNGKTNVPPLAQRFRESEDRCARLADALAARGVTATDLSKLWESGSLSTDTRGEPAIAWDEGEAFICGAKGEPYTFAEWDAEVYQRLDALQEALECRLTAQQKGVCMPRRFR